MSEYDGKSVCRNCRFFGEDLSRQKVCLRHPPQVLGAPLMGATIAGGPPQVNWIIQGAFPPVRDRTPGCGEFEPKAEIVN